MQGILNIISAIGKFFSSIGSVIMGIIHIFQNVGTMLNKVITFATSNITAQFEIFESWSAFPTVTIFGGLVTALIGVAIFFRVVGRE